VKEVHVKAEMLHIGFGGVVAANRILAIISPDSAPIKRMVREASDGGRIIDMTYGRRTKSVIVLDTGHLALAALQPDTIVGRLRQQREKETE
jgi:regulator of extracellular matrix RemA (YlzA/DUF370 family)